MSTPATAVMIAAMRRTSQIEMWIPPIPAGTPIAPNSKSTEEKCGEANQAAV